MHQKKYPSTGLPCIVVRVLGLKKLFLIWYLVWFKKVILEHTTRTVRILFAPFHREEFLFAPFHRGTEITNKNKKLTAFTHIGMMIQTRLNPMNRDEAWNPDAPHGCLLLLSCCCCCSRIPVQQQQDCSASVDLASTNLAYSTRGASLATLGAIFRMSIYGDSGGGGMGEGLSVRTITP